LPVLAPAVIAKNLFQARALILVTILGIIRLSRFKSATIERSVVYSD
jgi:hypothetical protein